MFKEDMLFKIAKTNIMKNKRLYKNVIFTIIFSFTCIIILNVITSSVNKVMTKVNDKSFGNWTMICEKLTEEMKNDDNITYGKIDIIGEVENIGTIASYDKKMFEIENQLLSGKIPENNEEIIIEQGILKQLGYEQKLNQKILLNNKEYLLVGILKNVSVIWNVDIPTMITTNQKGYNNLYVLVADDRENCLNKYYSENVVYNDRFDLEINISYADNNILYKFTNTLYKQDFYDNVIILISLVSIFSCLMILNYKRENQLFLLKNIGATHRQLIKMIFYEAIILIIPGLIISIILGIILSSFIMYLFTRYLSISFIYLFNIQDLLLQILNIFFFILFIYSLAYIPIYRMIIDGSTKKRGKTKLKKYHKVHKFNMFIYSIRRSIKHYKSTILIIVILILFNYITINIFSNYYQYQYNMDTLKYYKNYDYELTSNEEGITKKEINKYFKKYNTSYNQINYDEQGLYFSVKLQKENGSVLKDSYGGEYILDQQNYRLNLNSYDEDQNAMKLIENSLSKGRMPINENEAIAYVPYEIYYKIFHYKVYKGFNLNQLVYLDEQNTQSIKIVGIIYKRIPLQYSLRNQNYILSRDNIETTCIIVNNSTYKKLVGNKYNNIKISSKDENVINDIKSFQKEHSDFNLTVNENYYEIKEIQYLQKLCVDTIISISIFILGIYILDTVLKNKQYEHDKEYNTLRLIGALKSQIIFINIIEIFILLIPIPLIIYFTYINTGYVYGTYVDMLLPTIFILIINIVIIITIQILSVIPHINQSMVRQRID